MGACYVRFMVDSQKTQLVEVDSEESNLYGFSLAEMEHFFRKLGEKPFRAKQLFQWIYKYGVDDFEEMTDFSKSLRIKLNSTAKLVRPNFCGRQSSTESEERTTQKLLFQLSDGQKIETVYIPDDARRTVCVSTQAGCAVGCTFCATGWMGFKRNLTVGEIVGQLGYVLKKVDPTISNIVFMGMGEPFLNYENVIRAAQIFSSESGMSIAAKHITISTSGIIPRIYQYADDGHSFNLAISLNATTSESRRSVMPITSKYSMEELLKAADYYIRSRRRTHLTLEYVLLAGVNDSDEDARRLKKMVSELGRCKLNVIPYNPIEGPSLKRPSEDRINAFLRKVSTIQSPLTLRRSRGQDIAAACGQLAVQN